MYALWKCWGMKTCEPCHSSRHIFHQTSSSISGVRMYIPCSKGVILTAELTFVVKILCFVSQKSLYRSVGPKGSEADGKFLTTSTEFDKNSSKWSYYSTDHKNYIKIFFEHFPSKKLEPQKSTFGDIILEIKLF